MNQLLESNVRLENGTAVINLVGEINATAEDTLNTAYSAAEKGDPSAILLDFKNVNYINSTGIALIVSLLAQARKSHRRMMVCGLSEHYQEIFRITRLSDFMQIYSDERSALSG